MLGNGAWFWLLAGCLPCLCQERVPPIESLKRKVLDDLAHLPNYTCTETIERWTRRERARNFDQLDRCRLEVGYVGGKELFGWPGGEQLAEEDVTRMVAGTVSNGDFALMVDGLFNSPGVVFSAPDEELREGRTVLRYQYTVSLAGSNWVIRVPGRHATVAYHGSLRVDRERLDVLELETVAEKIPPALGYRSVQRVLRFARVSFGASDFLLPASGTLRSTDLRGDESRNDVVFRGCHQYAAESSIVFDEPAQPVAAAGAAKVEAPVELPADFEVELDLVDKIDSDTAAVGDPFTAVLRQAVTEKGLTVVPKGAVLHGRIQRLDLIAGRRYLDLDFLYLVEAAGRRIDIHMRANSLSVPVWNLRDGNALPNGPTAGNTIRTGVSWLNAPLHSDRARLVLAAGSRLSLHSRAVNR